MPQTINIKTSHMRLMERSNIEVGNITDDNIKNTFSKLILENGKPPSDNYKISILKSIKTIHTTLRATPKSLGLKTVRSKKLRMNDSEYIDSLMKVVKFAYTYSIEPEQSIQISRSFLDCVIAILCITSIIMNNLSELYNLLESDIIGIQQQVLNSYNVYPILFDKAYRIIERLIKYRRDNFTINIRTSHGDRSNHCISCTADAINKKFKHIYKLVNLSKNFDYTIGIQSLRSLDRDLIHNMLQTQ